MQRRRGCLISGCALLVLIAAGVVVVITPTVLALRLAGFRAEGHTEEILGQRAAIEQPTIQWWERPLPSPTPPGATPPADGDGGEPAPASPTPDPNLPTPLDAVVVDIWFLSQPTTFSAQQIHARRLESSTIDGRTTYYIEFDEAGVNAYLNDWFGEMMAQEARISKPWVDLKPGGAVIYADLDLEVGRQRVGAVFMLDASGRQFILAGVDISGQLYSTPPEGRIADLTSQLEAEGNRALDELIFIDPAGHLTIQTINLDEDQARILAY